MAEPARRTGAGTGDGTFATGAVATVRRVIGGIGWWFSSVMGDNAYRRYVDHLARHHPGGPVPTEKQYWRERYAAMDSNPAARCC